MVSGEIDISEGHYNLYDGRRVYGGGNGLSAAYYEDKYLTGHAKLDHVENIDFQWGRAHPFDWNDGFSVKFRGKIVPPSSGKYRFYIGADDGVTLRIGDKMIVDDYRRSKFRERRGEFDFDSTEPVNIEIDYVDFGGHAALKMEWIKLSGEGSAPLGRQLVPKGAFYSN